uniref:Uncharacterized protein n=1 Tax=Eptatretus burgeri TaxID=7764 RepID=A0A8C4WX25_EPTBU
MVHRKKIHDVIGHVIWQPYSIYAKTSKIFSRTAGKSMGNFTQVVAGILYKMDLKLGKTSCRKSQHDLDDENCSFLSGPEQKIATEEEWGRASELMKNVCERVCRKGKSFP